MLREFGASKGNQGWDETSKLFGQAADEIDQLRSDKNWLRAQRDVAEEKLRTLQSERTFSTTHSFYQGGSK